MVLGRRRLIAILLVLLSLSAQATENRDHESSTGTASVSKQEILDQIDTGIENSAAASLSASEIQEGERDVSIESTESGGEEGIETEDSEELSQLFNKLVEKVAHSLYVSISETSSEISSQLSHVFVVGSEFALVCLGYLLSGTFGLLSSIMKIAIKFGSSMKGFCSSHTSFIGAKVDTFLRNYPALYEFIQSETLHLSTILTIYVVFGSLFMSRLKAHDGDEDDATRAAALALKLKLEEEAKEQEYVIRSSGRYGDGFMGGPGNRGDAASTGKHRNDTDTITGNVDDDFFDDETIDCYGPRLCIFSGGTAFNSVVKVLSKRLTTRVTHILPVSDSGGSSREIIRVLGGPAIGDIRSRLIRLASDSTHESKAIKLLLEYRLSNHDKATAKEEMLSIVDGSHPIWDCSGGGRGPVISEAYKYTVKAFLAHFFDATLRRTSLQDRELQESMVNINFPAANSHSHPHSHPHPHPHPHSSKINSIGRNKGEEEFDFRGGSVGNFVFTGARLFFNSLEAAIFWFSSFSSIPRTSLVLPIINLNMRITIGAQLMDDSHLIGQDVISHPPALSTNSSNGSSSSSGGVSAVVDKIHGGSAILPSPIKRIYYLNQFGQEISPIVNPNVLRSLRACEAVIYAMGSLYTSIIPSLILPGVGSTIKALTCPKILILNGTEDRETHGMRVADYVMAIVTAMKQGEGENVNQIHRSTKSNASLYLRMAGRDVKRYISHVMYIDCDEVAANLVPNDHLKVLRDIGIQVHAIPPAAQGESTEEFLANGGGTLLESLSTAAAVSSGDGEGEDSDSDFDDEDETFGDDDLYVGGDQEGNEGGEEENFDENGNPIPPAAKQKPKKDKKLKLNSKVLRRFQEQSSQFVRTTPVDRHNTSGATAVAAAICNPEITKKSSTGFFSSVLGTLVGGETNTAKGDKKKHVREKEKAIEKRDENYKMLQAAVLRLTGKVQEKKIEEMKKHLLVLMQRNYNKRALVDAIRKITETKKGESFASSTRPDQY